MVKATKKGKQKVHALDFDYLFLAVVVAMLLFSLLMMYSIAMSDHSVPDGILNKHVFFVFSGVVLMVIIAFIPYTIWRNITPYLMVLLMVALVLVPFFGTQKYGASRAFEIGPPESPLLSVQPGVVARLMMVMYVAVWAVTKGDRLRTVFVGLIPFGVIIGSVVGLIILQPDWSMVLLIGVVGFMMFFFAGGDPIQITIAGAIMALMAYLIVSQVSPYAVVRVESFGKELAGTALSEGQVYWAGLSMQSGGLWGEGLGQGILKFGYVALAFNDTVFAIIGEELGWLGCLLVIGLFSFFTYRGYKIALETPDPFGSLLAFGVTSMIILPALLHFAVLAHVMPFMGIALPFFSYGGTQMWITMAGVGMILSVSRGKPKGEWYANLDRWWRNGWARLSGSRRRPRRPSYGS